MAQAIVSCCQNSSYPLFKEEEDDAGNAQGQRYNEEDDQKWYQIFLKEQYLNSKEEFKKWKVGKGLGSEEGKGQSQRKMVIKKEKN